MGRPLRLLDIAEHLPVDGQATAVRPDWLNPAVDGNGSGLEFRTSLTLDALIAGHRSRLIRATYAAQFMIVDCRMPVRPEPQQLPLHGDRFDSDMIPHADRDHEDLGAVTVVGGESDVLTGILSPPVLADACVRSDHDFGELGFLHRLHVMACEREASGASGLWERKARGYLADLFRQTHRREGDEEETSPESRTDDRPYEWPRGRDAFWAYIRSLHRIPGFVWAGGERGLPDRTTAIFISRHVAHCKGFSDQPRSGSKWRISLVPDAREKLEIDDKFAHLIHKRPDPVDAEWLRGEGA